MGALTPGPPPTIVFDPEPDAQRRSPWRTYRRALEEAPDWASHRLILQDDAELCRDFPETARRAVEARPNSLIVFCVLGLPKRWARLVVSAASSGSPWAALPIGGGGQSWVPVVAVAWPTAFCRRALDWVDEQGWPHEFIADDEIVGRIAKGLDFQVLATAPSLVDHPDLVVSAVGGRRSSGGANPHRVAACFIDDSTCDPLEIDWR